LGINQEEENSIEDINSSEPEDIIGDIENEHEPQ
jgi:hypothetical protein